MSAFDDPPASSMWDAPHPLEKVNAELRAELAAAREELAALRRDAERYRFIRDNSNTVNPHIQRMWAECKTPYPSPEEWDAAFDAAIQESRE